MQKIKNEKIIKNVISANWISIVIAIGSIIIGVGVTMHLANEAGFTADMSFNENNPYSVLRIDPKRGQITGKIELTQGTTATTYKMYYKRGSSNSYSSPVGFYYCVLGQLEGPHNLVNQIGWRNWDIKTKQTNHLNENTYKITETIQLD